MRCPIPFLSVLLLIAACSDSYRTPSLSGDPAQMSSDTLCYRYGSSGAQNEAIAAEINARGLECGRILQSDPLYIPGERF